MAKCATPSIVHVRQETLYYSDRYKIVNLVLDNHTAKILYLIPISILSVKPLEELTIG